MSWEDYCIKHLNHLNLILNDAILAIRVRKRSHIYKSCFKLISEIVRLQESIKYYNYVTKKDMIKLFGRVFIWCSYYQEDIKEDPIRHEIQLLGLQCRKHVKKNITRYNALINKTYFNLYGDDYYDCD